MPAFTLLLTLILIVFGQDAAADGREAKPLVYVRPEDNMAVVVERLFDNRCSMAPILSGDPNGAPFENSEHPGPAIPVIYLPSRLHQNCCALPGAATSASVLKRRWLRTSS
jgi:hypothetical protein